MLVETATMYYSLPVEPRRAIPFRAEVVGTAAGIGFRVRRSSLKRRNPVRKKTHSPHRFTRATLFLYARAATARARWLLSAGCCMVAAL